MRSLKEYLTKSIKIRNGPLIRMKKSLVFLWAIMIFSMLRFNALSRCSPVLLSSRNFLTWLSSWLSVRDFFVSAI